MDVSSGAVNSAAFDFSALIISWQKHSGRHHLPWQKNRDAYRVWLSEIMLQQTQVAAVIPYYERFLRRFPDVHSLAEVSIDEVMPYWSGLGYYSRARNLHRSAQLIVAQYQGQFPENPELLEELPGIGRSTAAAISAFAYGTQAAIMDGNVKRVFTRMFGVAGFPGEKKIEQALWQKAQNLLPTTGIQAYTQGLMDLGATICTRSRPVCSACPVQVHCVAHREGRTHELPTPKPKKATRHKFATMLLIMHQSQVLLERRPQTGIWGGLFSLPEVAGMHEHEAKNDSAALQDAARIARRFGLVGEVQCLEQLEHVFTHFKLHITPILFELQQRHLSVGEDVHTWLALSKVEQAALPAPIKTLLKSLIK